MKKFLLFSVYLSLIVGGCSPIIVQPIPFQSELSLPDVAGEFETTVIQEQSAQTSKPTQTYRWRFYRTAQRIETHIVHDQTGEIWLRSKEGNISYQRVFHKEQHVVDYLPGDLKAIGASPDWMAIATLIDANWVSSLISDGQTISFEQPAIHYTHSITENPVEVLWLEQAKLPAMIQKNKNGHLLITRLLALYPWQHSPWLAPDSSNYLCIDFSDLGDKENDAVINSILPKIHGLHHPED